VKGTSKKILHEVRDFYLDAWQACLHKQTNKRELRAMRAGIFCLGKTTILGSLEVIRFLEPSVSIFLSISFDYSFKKDNFVIMP
jgi:hypothetical protein